MNHYQRWALDKKHIFTCHQCINVNYTRDSEITTACSYKWYHPQNYHCSTINSQLIVLNIQTLNIFRIILSRTRCAKNHFKINIVSIFISKGVNDKHVMVYTCGWVHTGRHECSIESNRICSTLRSSVWHPARDVDEPPNELMAINERIYYVWSLCIFKYKGWCMHHQIFGKALIVRKAFWEKSEYLWFKHTSLAM